MGLVRTAIGDVGVQFFRVLFWVAVAGLVCVGGFLAGSFSFWSGFQLALAWIAAVVFWFKSAQMYRNRPGQKKIIDGSNDPGDYFFIAYLQGPAWALGKGREWWVRNWACQSFASLGSVSFTYTAWFLGAGFLTLTYFSVACWAGFSWLGFTHLKDFFRPYTLGAQAVDKAETLKAEVKEVPNSSDLGVKYGDHDGDAVVTVDSYIPPADRDRAAQLIAGRIEGAICHTWEAAEDGTWFRVTTSHDYADDGQRAAAKINDNPDFKPVVTGGETGEGWVEIIVPSERSTKARSKTADQLLAAAEGYVHRAEPEMYGDGDQISVVMYDEFPSYSAEILATCIAPALNEPEFKAVDVDGWRVAVEAPCEPTAAKRWELAETVRALVPGAELSAEPEPLGDGDRVRLKYLPEHPTEEQADQLAWNKLTERTGHRKPSDPPLEVVSMRRNEDGEIAEIVYRRGSDQALKDVEELAGYIADTLQSSSSKAVLIPDTSHAKLNFWYNTPTKLITLHPQDLPTLKKGKTHPPAERRIVADTSHYISDDGFLLGFTKWGEPVHIDYAGGAYHFGLWGLSGSGKGLTLIGMILHSLIAGHQITVISTKTADFQWAKDYGVKIVTVKSSKDIINAFDQTLLENDRREDLCIKHQVPQWVDLVARAERLAKRGDDTLLNELGETKRQYIFFDEVQKCMDKAELEGTDEHGTSWPKLIEGRMKAILIAGRSAAIGLGIITQSPLASAMSASGSSSTRSNVQAKIWVGRGEINTTCMAMGIDNKKPPPAVVSSEAHTIGNFLVKGRCDGPEAAELVTGRTPFVSTDYASVLAWELSEGKLETGAKNARQRLMKLHEIGELPEWLLPKVEAMPEWETYRTDNKGLTVLESGEDVTTVFDEEDGYWVEGEDGDVWIPYDENSEGNMGE